MTRIIGNLNLNQRSHIFRCLLYSSDYKKEISSSVGCKEHCRNVDRCTACLCGTRVERSERGQRPRLCECQSLTPELRDARERRQILSSFLTYTSARHSEQMCCPTELTGRTPAAVLTSSVVSSVSECLLSVHTSYHCRHLETTAKAPVHHST